MTQLLMYSPEVYSSLGDIETASAKVRQTDINIVADVLRKYGYQEFVGIGISHRHFDLKSNEVLLEVFSDEGSVTKPYPLDEVLQIGAVPCTFKFTPNGCHPVQYSLTKDENIVQWWLDEEFMFEIGEILIDRDLHDLFVLRDRPNDWRSPKFDPEIGLFVETNFDEDDEGDRRSILKWCRKDEAPSSMLFTMYGADGKIEYGCVQISACIPIPGGGHVKGSTHVKP